MQLKVIQWDFEALKNQNQKREIYRDFGVGELTKSIELSMQ